jgi:uncharacterized membrane protein YgcG
MGWTNSVVTNVGVDMLNESLAGHILTIDRAVGGSGVLAPAELVNATDVVDWRQDFKLLGIEDCEGGKKVKIQITNDGVTEGYELHQVATYAKLNYEEDYRLLFIMQDDRGVEVPSQEDNPDFLFELYAVIAVSNQANIKVNVDSSAVVSAGFLAESISLAVSDHNTDTGAHQDIRRAIETVGTAVETAQEAAENAATAAGDAKQAAADNAKAIQTLASQQSQLAGGMVCLAVIDFSIPTDAWVKDESATGRYIYYADVSDETVSSSHLPDATLDINSMEVAYNCGLCPMVQIAEDGKIRFTAQEAPTDTISGSCALWVEGGGNGGGSSSGSGGTSGSGSTSGGTSGGGSGGGGDATTTEPFVAEEATYATEEAVQDMLDDIFS